MSIHFAASPRTVLFLLSFSVATLGGSPAVTAQDWASTIRVEFPDGVPWDALSAAFTPPASDCDQPRDNCWGYLNCEVPPGGSWWANANVQVGHIDDDPYVDFLIVLSERLALAFGLDEHEADGTPTATARPYVIWAWFDDRATMYRQDLSADAATIADFDGDGRNEVAIVLGGPKDYRSTAGDIDYDRYPEDNPPFPGGALGTPDEQKRLLLLGVPDVPILRPGVSDCADDPLDFRSVPLPEILAVRWMDDNACDSGFSSQLEGQAARVNAAQFDLEDPLVDPAFAGYEIFLHTSMQDRHKAYAWDGSFFGLRELSCVPFIGGHHQTSTHYIHTIDLNGDGIDEILADGLFRFENGAETGWYLEEIQAPYTTCTTSSSRHADDMVPLDTDGDGSYDHLYLAVHECFDQLVPIHPDDLAWHPVNSPFVLENFDSLICDLTGGLSSYRHGTDVLVARLLAEPDSQNPGGRHVILTPKEYDGLYGGDRRSSVVVTPVANRAGELDELTYNLFHAASQPPNGPSQFKPVTIDWDGDRRTDEVYSIMGKKHVVLRLWEAPYAPCPVYEYSWRILAKHLDEIGGHQRRVADVFGDYREEIVIIGAGGIEILFNADDNSAQAHLHPKPLQRTAEGRYPDEAYVRRLVGYPWRPLDYRSLTTFDRLEVVPLTVSCQPGDEVAYRAVAHYVDAGGKACTIDVTDRVTWESGNPGVADFLAGSTLSVLAEGYAAIAARLVATPVVRNARPALMASFAPDATDPVVLYAGWGDTYAVEGDGPIPLRVEARVVGNSVGRVMLGDEDTIHARLNDFGTGGDDEAGDGIYTWTGIRDALPSTQGDLYLRIYVSPHDALRPQPRASSEGRRTTWPYLVAGRPDGSDPLPGPGFFLFPWASETFGDGPRLRGVGFGLTRLEAGVDGTITFLARAAEDPLDQILIYAESGISPQVLTVPLNDAGTWPDQLEGDGLWTGHLTNVSLFEGLYLLDFLPVSVTPSLTTGDAYPRLRIHSAD